MNETAAPRPGTLAPGQEPPPGARAIFLTKGWVAWVDEEDYASLAPCRWIAWDHQRGAYAMRNTGSPRKTEWMHRKVLNLPAGTMVDHLDHECNRWKVIDNRSRNLRPCTKTENGRNQRLLLTKGRKSSCFKGVSRIADSLVRPWVAHIRVNGRLAHLGGYREEWHAALAYDVAAVHHFGQFALTNFLAGVA